jgi:hypothetical protein
MKLEVFYIETCFFVVVEIITYFIFYKDLKQELKVRNTSRTSALYEDISLAATNNNQQSETSSTLIQNLSINGDSDMNISNGSETLGRLRGGSKFSNSTAADSSMTSTTPNHMKRKKSSIFNPTRLLLKVNTILNPRRFVCGHSINQRNSHSSSQPGDDSPRKCNKCKEKVTLDNSSSSEDYKQCKSKIAK